MDRPLNIMLLQGEDVGCHLGCYGDAYARTPNLDRLAAEGALYRNAFSHAPVCAPSRGGMVTGCYPWSIGNHHMRSTLINPPRMFTHELVDAGYHVSWPTKLDFNFEPTDGWCSDTDAWWERPAPAQPSFLYSNFQLTHESRMFNPPPEWHGSEFPCPEASRHDPRAATPPPYLPDLPELRQQVASYHDALSAIDHQIGERLQWLDDNGLRDNTIVIFLSDHGRGLPREKRWCYDAGIHVPLIVRWPGKIPPGTVIDDLIALVDIAPTILALTGTSVPSHYQGQIFLGPETAQPRNYVFAGRDRMDGNFDKVRAARDQRWLYIRNDTPGLPWAQKQWYMEQQPIMPIMRALHARGELAGDAAVFFAARKPPEELYDTSADPHQIHNLAGDPAHADTLARMRHALAAHLQRFGDLGETDETELIDRGLLTDRFADYRARSSDLPPEQQIGPKEIPMTLNEARPWQRG